MIGVLGFGVVKKGNEMFKKSIAWIYPQKICSVFNLVGSSPRGVDEKSILTTTKSMD